MDGKRIIALAGGTGNLGARIGNAILDKPEVQLMLLVRPGSREKAAGLEKRGAQVVEGTIGPDQERALASLCQGASTVISAPTPSTSAPTCRSCITARCSTAKGSSMN
jgi:hypothetical protein